jgi:hypothetical protein
MPDMQHLEERMAAIERRLDAIERQLTDAVLPPATPQPESVGETTGALLEEASLISVVGLIGRTLIVLGGAFLIRFITESKTLPQFAGTIVGIAYALFWVLLADYEARKTASESATFHGVSAALIGFPLLWETTLKFAYLTPTQSAAVVTVFTGIALVVAWHRDMRSFALVIAAPAALTMLALGFATKTLPPFLGALLLLASATLVLAYERKWYLLGVFVAFVADFAIFIATVIRLLRPQSAVVATFGLTALCLAQLALVAVYFGTFSFLVLVRKRNLSLVEVFQIVAVLLLAFGGLVGVSLAAPAARTALGLLILVLTGGCYVGAYRFLWNDRERVRTFVVYSAAAATAAVVSAALTFRGASLPMILALGALACSVVATRGKCVSLGVHGAVYILAAAVSSGLAWGTVLILWGSNPAPELWTHTAPWVVFVVALAVVLTPPPTSDIAFERAVRRTRLPATILAAVTLGALVISVAFGFRSEIAEGEAIVSSILRTAVISLTAILLALLSRKDRFAQSKWLVVPCLLIAAAKLLAQDVPSGKPSVLFGSLALFGAALIIAPRLLRVRP